MDSLSERAHRIAALLKERGETVSVAESSTGGLVSAALLAVPGASAYFVGGAVLYTRAARLALLGLGPDEMAGLRPSTERYAALLAATMRETHGSVWGLGESGAAGPTGNSYGDASGHVCIAVAPPIWAGVPTTATIETGATDRPANMRAFAAGLLDLFIAELEREPKR